jgi:hypothetical protein
MKRGELEHVLRASAAIAQESTLVVIGSQAVLLPYPDAPAELLMSNEVDLYPSLHPERADLIEGSIGALSTFHDTFGYHADAVGPDTAVLPADWMTHAKLYYVGDVTVITPELHDLAVSKCAAGRDKDADWVRALLRHHMIEPERLMQRIHALDATQHAVPHIAAWAQRRIHEAATP